MKKIYTSIALCAITLSSFAGTNVGNRPVQVRMAKTNNNQEFKNSAVTQAQSSIQAPFDTIWSENFAVNPTLGGWVQSGADQIWRRTLTGPNGNFSSTAQKMNSTTKANGILIFCIDSANVAAGTGAAPTIKEGSITSPSINLAAFPAVHINFQHYMRFCCATSTIQVLLQVSNDGGTTWVDFDLKKQLGSNDLNDPTSAKVKKESINITSVAGGQANVKIRFTMLGAAAYWWQIDDIAIVEAGQNDLKLNHSYLDFAYTSGGHYNRIPLTQVTPIAFRTAYVNDGALTQHMVKTNAEVKLAGAVVYSKNSSVKDSILIAIEDTLLIDGDSAFVATATGLYTSKVTVSQLESDDKLINNTISKTFSVTTDEFAFDNDDYAGSGSVTTADFIGGEADGSQIGSLFEIETACATDKVKFHLDCAAGDVGLAYKVIIYKLDGQAFSLVYEADVDTVKSSNRLQWVTKNINVVNLEANSAYLVGLEVVDGGGGVKSLVLADDITTEQPGINSFIALAGNADPSLGGVRATPFIRLIIRNDVGVNELSPSNSINAFPNPTTGLLNIKLASDNNATAKLFNINGEVVYTENVSNKTNTTINLSNFAKGIYTLQIVSNKGVATQKIVKQ